MVNHASNAQLVKLLILLEIVALIHQLAKDLILLDSLLTMRLVVDAKTALNQTLCQMLQEQDALKDSKSLVDA